ncbi:reticulocyte binding protein 1b [Plasmodium gonderi]|uniref:Reticulocyte binding protein 1b n=1 Tax=Plasmodium gonderi TaxID=77519 RepID=A0A1Y1JC35_PLAGO|nr:reticulocyte binding protein 1b [Plasmodium gonderi]GAW80091.1 reticulocyte binding protein 1b [Plasmodium gonderi]
MKKGFYWTTFFGLMFASFDINKGENVLHNIRKHYDNFSFFTFYEDLKKNKIFKNKGVKKKKFKSVEIDNAHEFDKEFNKTNNEDGTGQNESYNSSFISLGSTYPKNDQPYDKDVGKVILESPHGTNDIVKSSHSLENTGNFNVPNEKLGSLYKIVLEDYINNLKDSDTIFLMEFDYVDLQSIKEIRYLIPEGKEYYNYYNDELEKKINENSNKLDELIKNSIKAKNEMIKIDAVVKFRKNSSSGINIEDEDVKKLKLAKETLEKYVNEYTNKIKPVVHDIRNKAYEYLKKSNCTHHCNAYILNYARLLNKYIKNIATIKDESVITIDKSINDYNTLDKILEHAKKDNIDINDTIYLLKILGEEVKDLQNMYVINRSLINDASSILSDIHANGRLFNTKEGKILNSSKELINNYCVFHHIMILNIPIKKMYEEKIKESNDLFSKIIDKLKEEAYSLINIIFVDTESVNILKSSEKIVEYAEKIFQENKKKVEFFKRYPNIKTHPKMEDIENEYKEEAETKEEILRAFELISNKCESLYHIRRNRHLNKVNEITKYENSTTKALLLLDEISNVNEERNVIKQGAITLNNMHENMLNLKNKINEIEIKVDNVDEVNKLKEKEEKLAQYEKEIKEKIKDMTNKIRKLKEIIVLRDKGNQDIATINELINIESYSNLHEFINKKDKANDEINSIFKDLYNGDMYDLIETIGTIVREKRKIIDETFNINQMDQVEKHIDELRSAYTKLDTITNEKLINTYDKLRNETNNTEYLKSYIAKKQSEDLNNKMTESLDIYKSEYDELKKNIVEYEKEEKILEQCKENTLKKEEEYFSELRVSNDALKETYSCSGFDKIKNTFSKSKYELSQKMDHIKNVKKNMDKYLKFYNHMENYFHLLDDSNYTQGIKTLKGNIQRELTNKQLSMYENIYQSKTEKIQKIIQIIESLNKIIDSHNRLNKGIHECKGINVSIDTLKIKTAVLKDELQKAISSIEKDVLVSENVKKILLNRLKSEVSNINGKLDENNMGVVVKKATDLIKIYTDSKRYLHEKREEYHLQDSSEKVNDWGEIKREVDQLNAHYSAFNDNKDNLFISNSLTYLESIYSIVRELINNIREEKNKIESSVKGIEQKLQAIELNEYYKSVKIAENESTIKNMKEDIIPKLEEKIRYYSNQLTTYDKQSDNLNNIDKNQGSDLTHILDIIKQMEDVYKELIKIPSELQKERDDINNIDENIKKVQLEYERKLIDEFLKNITQTRNEAQDKTQQIIALINKIEEIKKETVDTKDRALATSNCEKHLGDAKKLDEEIKHIEELSKKLKGDTNVLNSLNEVVKIREDVYLNMEKVINHYNHIKGTMNEINEINELLLSENYNSIINFIVRNVNESNKYSELIRTELIKSEDATEHVKVRFREAEALKEQMKTNLEDNDADKIIKEIKEIRKIILNEIKNTGTYLLNSEKFKTSGLLHFDSAKEGKTKFDYLKDHDNPEHKRITQYEINEVLENMVKVQHNIDEADKYTKQTRVLNESTLQYEKLINDLLNESLIRKVKFNCEKLKTEINMVMNEMKNADIKSQEESNNQEQIVKEMKEQSFIEDNENEELNEGAMKALLNIKNYRQQLDNILLSIKSVRSNMEQILRSSSTSVITTLAISQLRNENDLDNLKIVEENYKTALKKVKHENQIMKNEEKRLNELYKDAIRVKEELEEQKKNYETELLKMIKDNADKRMATIELTKNEINLLVNPSKSIFFKLKLEKLDIMNYLNSYTVRMRDIYDECVKIYGLIKSYEFPSSIPSTTYSEAQIIRIKAQKEKEELIKKKEELKELLSYVKKEESSRLLNEMIRIMNSKKEDIAKNYTKINEYVENIKKNITDLKVLNDINNGSNILNNAINNANEIKSTKYMYHKKEAENIYENMIHVANYFLNDKIKIEPKKGLNVEVASSEGSDMESYILGKIKEANGIIKKIEDDTGYIKNKQIEGEKLSTEANNIYSVAKLKNEFNNNKNKAKLEEVFVLSEIEEALNKLKNVDKVKCHYDIYDNILENNEEYENFKKISSIYNSEKIKIVKEDYINEMKTNINNYKDMLRNLDKKVEYSSESNSEIADLQKYNVEIEDIIKKLIIIDNNVKGINSSLDELLDLGNSCQFRRNFIISSSVNIKISKYLVMIRKQKENISKCLEYVKNNYQNMINFVSQLNEFQDGLVNSINLEDKTSDADKCYNDFVKEEQEAIKTVNYIKKEIYSFNDNVDATILENRIKNIVDYYNKLKIKKVEIDDIYKNMNMIKLNEVERSHDIFNHIAELFKKVEEIKGKELLERENNLKSIYNFIKLSETDLNNFDKNYTPESREKINKIFNNINSRIKRVHLNDDNENEYNNVKKYVNQTKHLMNTTNFMVKELEMLQNENKNEFVENTNIRNELTEQTNNIMNNINSSKGTYGKIFDMIKDNETILERIILKKKDINDTLDNLNKTKENLLMHLTEGEKLYHMRKKLAEVNNNTDEIIKKYRTYEEITNKLLSMNVRKFQPKVYKSVTDIDEELNYIKTFNNDLIDSKFKIEKVLENNKKKKDEMDMILSTISRDNMNIYEYAKGCIDSVINVAKKLAETIKNMDTLIKENEATMEELNAHRKKLQNDKNMSNNLVNIEKEKIAQENMEAEILSKPKNMSLKDIPIVDKVIGNKEIHNVNWDEVKQENVILEKGFMKKNVHTSDVSINNKKVKESDKMVNEKSTKQINIQKNGQDNSHLSNDHNNTGIHTLYMVKRHNTSDNNYNASENENNKNDELNKEGSFFLFIYTGVLCGVLFMCICVIYYFLDKKKMYNEQMRKGINKEKKIVMETKINAFEEKSDLKCHLREEVIDVSFVGLEDSLE